MRLISDERYPHDGATVKISLLAHFLISKIQVFIPLLQLLTLSSRQYLFTYSNSRVLKVVQARSHLRTKDSIFTLCVARIRLNKFWKIQGVDRLFKQIIDFKSQHIKHWSYGKVVVRWNVLIIFAQILDQNEKKTI